MHRVYIDNETSPLAGDTDGFRQGRRREREMDWSHLTRYGSAPTKTASAAGIVLQKASIATDLFGVLR